MAQEQVRQFIDQATQSIQSGQFDQALQLVDQALAIDPNSADAYVLRGIGLSQTGQPAAATDAFTRATDLDPNNAKAFYNLAVHLYSQGQKPEALNAAQRAADLDAGHSGARQLITTIETELGMGVRPTGPNPNDPLSMPPVSEKPTATTAPPMGISPPPPVESSGPVPFNQGAGNPYTNPYMKDPYESQEHSIKFIESMGGLWTAIGWILSAINLLGGILLIYVIVQTIPHVNPNDQFATQRYIEANFVGLINVIRVCAFGGMIGIIAWTIMDILDRRSNPIWLLPGIVCACCQFGWLTLPIYIVAGRNK